MLIITKRRAVKLLYRFIIDRMLNPTSRLRTVRRDDAALQLSVSVRGASPLMPLCS